LNSVSFFFNCGNYLQYLTILSDTRQYLTIPDHTLTIPTNTNNTYQFQPLLTYSKQYLINFVSVGIAWYQQYIEFCHKYTTPVLSWYQHGMVLMVFCLSGIVTIKILAIFRKPSMLTPYCPS